MTTAIKINDKSAYKIGLYIRASTEEQGAAKNPEGTIKNQEQRLRGTVDAKNLNNYFGEIVEIFIDDGISAKNTNRPEFQRMLKAIENKEINMVMVTEYSRLSRNMSDFSQMWELFKNFGCGLISLREQFDTSSAAGEMMLYNMANLAQFERRLTSERVKSSRIDRASRGLFNGGVVPIGYRSVEGRPGHLEIDPEEAEIIKKVFQTFLREGSVSKTAKWMNDNGYSAPRMIHGGGNKARIGHFVVGNTRKILANKTYIGIVEYPTGGQISEAKAVWGKIIDKVTFSQVQKLIKNNHRKKKPTNPSRYPYILSGLVFCKKCGDVMCGKSAHGRNGKVGYYEHSWSMRKNSTLTKKVFECEMFKRVPAKKLEPFIEKEVLKLITNEKFAKELIEEAQKVHNENYSLKSEKLSLKKEISSYSAQTEALAERIATLPIDVPIDPLYKMLKKLEQETNRAKKEYQELEKKDGIGVDTPAEIVSYKKFLSTLNGLWKELDKGSIELRTRLIKRLIHRIEIDNNGVEIHFHVGNHQIKKESIIDSFLNYPQPVEISENLKKISKNLGSRTCTNGAP